MSGFGVSAMASSGSKSSGEVAGIGAVDGATDLQVGAEGDDGRHDVAEEEGGGGPLDAVLGHEHERRHEDGGREHDRDEHGGGAAVPDARLGEVHGRDRPRDRRDHQRGEDVGRLLVLLAVERDDQVAARASRWPRRPPSGPPATTMARRTWARSWAPSRPPSASRAWPMAVGT